MQEVSTGKTGTIVTLEVDLDRLRALSTNDSGYLAEYGLNQGSYMSPILLARLRREYVHIAMVPLHVLLPILCVPTK
jgi:hypothetical protein